MPPRSSSKKKTVPTNAASTDDHSSASSKAKTKKDQIDQLFDSYANSSIQMIDPEGIEALCSDLGVDHTDVRILMFAWKLKAEKQGYFTLDEWRTGLKALGVNTLSKLKRALLELESEVRTPPNFDDFYSYAFQYCLTEEKQKTIDIESICELLSLVLQSQFQPQVSLLIQYLKFQSDFKVITLDQWKNFLRFCNQISFPDLANYDPMEAWPLILDDFVDWMKQKHS